VSTYPLPEGAPGWCYVADGEPVWVARPRWDGFGYEVRQIVMPSSKFIGSRMLATTIVGARALLPRRWVIEECGEHGDRGSTLYAYRGAPS
jgi:hypothetical protein